MIRNPQNRWLYAGVGCALVVAVAAGIASYSAMRQRALGSVSEPTRARLAAVTILPVRLAALQRQWLTATFEPQFLVAQAGPPPCVENKQFYGLDKSDPVEHLLSVVRQQPTNRFPALLLATELANAGKFDDAEHVTMEALVAGPDVFEKDLPQLQLLTLIHLHHVRGVARLSGTRYEPPWTSLKNAIGGAALLEASRQLGRRPGDPIGRAVLIPKPNCRPPIQADALSVEDLRNNLLVAYMRGTYRNPVEREQELARESEGSALRRLLAGQLRLQRANVFPNESELWALSNAERIVDAGITSDARLNVNIALVIDWWTAPERCPSNLCTPQLLGALQPLRTSLVERGIRTRNVAPQQRGAFARDVTRLLASAPMEPAVVESATGALRSWLPPSEAEVLDMLHAAGVMQREFPRWIIEGHPEPAMSRDETLEEAAMYDYVASALPQVESLRGAEKRHAVRFLKSLDTGGEMPPALDALMRQFSGMDRFLINLTTSRWSLAVQSIAIAGGLWLAMVWLLVQIWEWRMFRTALYKVELDYWRSEPHPTE